MILTTLVAVIQPSYYILEAPFPNYIDIMHGPWRAMYELALGGFTVSLSPWVSAPTLEGVENKFVHKVLKQHSVVTARRVCSVDVSDSLWCSLSLTSLTPLA